MNSPRVEIVLPYKSEKETGMAAYRVFVTSLVEAIRLNRNNEDALNTIRLELSAAQAEVENLISLLKYPKR